MCISKSDLDQRIKKIRSLKMLRAKVDEAIDMFEAEVIDFLKESQSFSMWVLIIKLHMQNSPARQ